MDAAGYIYIYIAAIIFAGLICVTLLLVVLYQYGNNKKINRKTAVLTTVSITFFVAVFWEPVATTLIVIPSMCREYGGLHIYMKVNANGFYSNVFDKRYLTDYGYSFLEYVDYSHNSKKKYVTKRIGQNGDIAIDSVWNGKSPLSRYQYITRKRFEIETTGIMKYIDVRGEREYVMDTRTNEILGEINRYYYAGSDFRYAMHRLLADKAETCSSSERDPKEIPLPVHILKPTR
ncbi:MAG: hypothetical protein AB2792_07050 [Candidatus Thiodiazotropha sp.]